MCKRFFVEVVGLGEDGKERLVDAGIAQDSIMVIDEDQQHRNKPILNAIHKACGVTKDEIFSNDRRRNQTIARFIYIWYAIKGGDTIQTLCDEMKRDRTTIGWYLKHYQDSLQGDKSLACVSSHVDGLLKQDPCWRPIEPIKFNTSEKKGKKRHSKKKKRNKVERTPEEIEAILDKRQMKIQWKS